MPKRKKGFSKFRSKWWALCVIERQIRSHRACTAATLAADLEVNPRTIRRYIDFLREELDAPIKWNRGEKRFELTDTTWTMPNVHLSDPEMAALAVATRSMSAVMPAPFTQPLEKLLAKLLDALPESSREELRLLQDRVDFVPASINSKGQERVEQLIEALRDERVVEMTYFTPHRGTESRRRVDPYHLRFFAGAWYLVAYDHQKKLFPVFNLARIRKLVVTDETFTRKKFSPADYFSHTFGITRGGPPRTIRIRLTGRAAATASERAWPETFTCSPQPNGAVLLTGQVAKLDDLLYWLASIGGEATLLPDG